jgi:hypothetical protein
MQVKITLYCPDCQSAKIKKNSKRLSLTTSNKAGVPKKLFNHLKAFDLAFFYINYGII